MLPFRFLLPFATTYVSAFQKSSRAKCFADKVKVALPWMKDIRIIKVRMNCPKQNRFTQKCSARKTVKGLMNLLNVNSIIFDRIRLIC